jgi:hypothetical protein
MARFASTGGGLMPRPSRDFVPAADLLFAPPKSRQKALPCKTAPVGVPCDARSPGPHPTHFATLRSDKGVRSQMSMLAALAPRAPALLGGLEGEAPNSRTANSQARTPAGGCIPLTPFSPAEQRKALRACAQRTSSSDSGRLFDRNVAKGVPPGPSRPEQRREPRSEAQGRGGRGELFAYFLAGQKVGRPPGRNPGMGLATNTTTAEATRCL